MLPSKTVVLVNTDFESRTSEQGGDAPRGFEADAAVLDTARAVLRCARESRRRGRAAARQELARRAHAKARAARRQHGVQPGRVDRQRLRPRVAGARAARAAGAALHGQRCAAACACVAPKTARAACCCAPGVRVARGAVVSRAQRAQRAQAARRAVSVLRQARARGRLDRRRCRLGVCRCGGAERARDAARRSTCRARS